jgi:hypothetical protein
LHEESPAIHQNAFLIAIVLDVPLMCTAPDESFSGKFFFFLLSAFQRCPSDSPKQSGDDQIKRIIFRLIRSSELNAV